MENEKSGILDLITDNVYLITNNVSFRTFAT